MNPVFLNVEVAVECGVNAAILFSEISDEVEHFKACEQNFHEGTYWTYNSMKSFSKSFPYFTERQIEVALKKLKNSGFIKTGNYNETPFDQTKWYALTEKGYSVLNS